MWLADSDRSNLLFVCDNCKNKIEVGEIQSNTKAALVKQMKEMMVCMKEGVGKTK